MRRVYVCFWPNSAVQSRPLSGIAIVQAATGSVQACSRGCASNAANGRFELSSAKVRVCCGVLKYCSRLNCEHRIQAVSIECRQKQPSKGLLRRMTASFETRRSPISDTDTPQTKLAVPSLGLTLPTHRGHLSISSFRFGSAESTTSRAIGGRGSQFAVGGRPRR